MITEKSESTKHESRSEMSKGNDSKSDVKGGSVGVQYNPKEYSVDKVHAAHPNGSG